MGKRKRLKTRFKKAFGTNAITKKKEKNVYSEET